MKMVFIVLGASAAAIMGFCLWLKIKTIYAQIQLKKSYKQTVAVNPIATSLPLNIHGIERIILERMVLLSMQVGRRPPCAKGWIITLSCDKRSVNHTT